MRSSINKTFLLLFLIFTLIIISQSQRGRGGGGRSSGSSSSRSRSYGGYGGSGTSSAGSTMGIIAGSVCAVFCCFGAAVSDWKSLCKNQFKKGNSRQEIQAQFQRLKSTKNNVSNLIMKRKHYEQIKNQFLQMISAHTSIFQYTQDGQSTKIFNTKIKEFPENQFIDKIELTGYDQVGSWTGQGFFLASINGPYVWWMKNYDDKQAAGQVEDSQFLVYESTSFYQGTWQGRWYYEGDQNDQIYSGTWSLSDPSNEFPLDPMSDASPKVWNPFEVLGGRFNPPPL